MKHPIIINSGTRVNLYSQKVFHLFLNYFFFFFTCYESKNKTKWPKMNQNAKSLDHQQLLPNQTSNNHDIGRQI